MKIKSNCCGFSKGLVEEVHVLKENCPIKRAEGQRNYENHGTKIEDCTCVYFSALSGGYVVPKCQYYNGTKKNGKSGSYFVDCLYQ